MANHEHGFPQRDPDSPRNAISTRDHDTIRQWAARHRAEPATGEATASGPATTHVRDGDVGIRFNFPGWGRFRPIAWEEWFEHFDRFGLTFVYEMGVPDRAHLLWEARGKRHGHDQEDWFDAARELQAAGSSEPSARYRFISADRTAPL